MLLSFIILQLHSRNEPCVTKDGTRIKVELGVGEEWWTINGALTQNTIYITKLYPLPSAKYGTHKATKHKAAMFSTNFSSK